MGRQLVSSGSPYESVIGFSRAVREGNFVAVGGTAPIGPQGNTVGVGDAAAQARRCLEIIRGAWQQAGARLEDVVRTRTFLTNIEDWEAVARIRGEYFRDIKPVDTVMQVSGFIDQDWLVEIEVDAVLSDDD